MIKNPEVVEQDGDIGFLFTRFGFQVKAIDGMSQGYGVAERRNEEYKKTGELPDINDPRFNMSSIVLAMMYSHRVAAAYPQPNNDFSDQSPIQQTIELIVTNGIGYDSRIDQTSYRHILFYDQKDVFDG